MAQCQETGISSDHNACIECGTTFIVTCICVQDRDQFVVQVLNGVGDFIDLKHALSPYLRPNFHRMSLAQLKEYIVVNGHCSALVKVQHLCY